MGTSRAEDSVEIAAPPAVVFDVLTDYEAMPGWQSAVRETTVLERDDEGRGLRVGYEIDVKVKRLRYVLGYRYDAPHRIDVALVDGDLKALETTYVLDPAGSDGTRVIVQIALDPGVFVPGPVRSFLTGVMLRGLLHELRDRSQALHADPS